MNPMCRQVIEGPNGDFVARDPYESTQTRGSDHLSVANGVGPHLTEVIPPGQICGAGRDKYSRFNTPSDQWPYSAHSPGATIAATYSSVAHHPGQIDVYVPQDGVDPTKTALGWENLKSEPIGTISTDTPNGYSDEYFIETYEGTVKLPTSVDNDSDWLTLVYVWRRSDSDEVFYNCSDIKLVDGAKGEFYNVAGNGEVSQNPELSGVVRNSSPSSAPVVTEEAESDSGAESDSSNDATRDEVEESTGVGEATSTVDETESGETLSDSGQILSGMSGKSFQEQLQMLITLLLRFFNMG